VLAGEDAVAANGVLVEVPGALGEPVADCLGDGVVLGVLVSLDSLLFVFDKLG